MTQPTQTHAPLEVVQLPLGMIGTNCYIANRQGSDRCVVVDPGADPDRVLTVLEERGLSADAVLVTHCHWDHIGAVAPVARAQGAPVYMSRIEAPVLADPAPYAPEGMVIEPWEVDHLLDGGETLELAGITFTTLLLPGHSPGTIGFLVGGADSEPDVEAHPPMLFIGDNIFEGSVGRTDLPFADHDALMQSCLLVLSRMLDETILLPGHGAPTTVGRERRTNPFLRDL